MAWWRYNAGTRVFEISNNNGASFFAPELDAAIITHGSFPAARLPANIAYNNINNNFVAQNLADGTTIYGNNSLLGFHSAFAPLDQKYFRILTYANGNIQFEFLNDAGSVLQFSPIVLERIGAVNLGGTVRTAGLLSVGSDVSAASTIRAGTSFYERGRSYAVGQWQDITTACSPNGFTVNTWNVTACRIGDTVLINIYVTDCSAAAGVIAYIGTPYDIVRRCSGYGFLNYAGTYIPLNVFGMENSRNIQFTRATYPDAWPAFGAGTLHISMTLHTG